MLILSLSSTGRAITGQTMKRLEAWRILLSPRPETDRQARWTWLIPLMRPDLIICTGNNACMVVFRHEFHKEPHMKRIAVSALILFAVMFQTGCSSFERTTFQTLAASKAVIDQAQVDYEARTIPHTQAIF